MKKIAILGSTGSIGTQTLDVVREQGDLTVTALAAGSNIKLLEEQIREFHPKLVAVWDEKKAEELKNNVKDCMVTVTSGMEGLLSVATIPDSDVLVTAIVGMLGIRPTIAAMKAGKDIALANKETLVTEGHIKNSFNGFRGTIPWKKQRRTGACYVRRRFKTSKLEHGKKNNGRFSDFGK